MVNVPSSLFVQVTPFCVTVDFDTLEDDTVTIRDRDTMEQVRVKIEELESWINEKIEF